MDITPAFWISIVIFAATFLLIITERAHRAVIGFFGAITMIIAGTLFDFYRPADALAAIDFNTIGLLMGMMIIVVVLEKTGFFQYLGIFTAKKSKGKPWLLLAILGTLTSVLSMILDNVTTIILIAPVTIIIARIIKINPIPLLMTEALLANIGGVATLIGDPTAIMIGSTAGFTFNQFLTHSLPVVAVTWIVVVLTLLLLFRKELKVKPDNIDELLKMDASKAIKDKTTLIKTLVILGIVIILFFFHSILHLPPAMVALIGAALVLVSVAPKNDPQELLQNVELSVLFFFASLFMIVGGLEHAGVLEVAASLITNGAANNIVITAIIILWSTALVSAIVDNIPMTVAMLPIITYLGTQGIDVTLLWWALVWGVGFGGNGSPIGSTAGVIVVSKSEQANHPITFKSWFKTGSVTTIISLLVASGAILLFGDLLAS